MSDFDLVRKKKAMLRRSRAYGAKVEIKEGIGEAFTSQRALYCSSEQARPSLHMSIDDV